MLSPTIRFAILDDQELVRTGIINILTTFPGFSCISEASNSAELLNSLDCENHPDICILGINNSSNHCYIALKAITEKWPHLKTLALSVYQTDDAIIQMLLRGVNGYVVKTCSPTELQNALISIQNNDYYFSDIVTPRIRKLVRNESAHKSFIFSQREEEFMKLCTLDITYKEIADRMLLSIKTIEHYREALFTKLNLKSRTGLVSYLFRNGLA